jgi:hypothetical protein
MSNKRPEWSRIWVRSFDSDSVVTISLIDDSNMVIFAIESKKTTDVKSTLAQFAKKIGLSSKEKLILREDPERDDTVTSIGQNGTSWQGSDALLIVGSSCGSTIELPIAFNPPSVREISLPRRLIVGCCIVPRITVEFGLLHDCRLLWTRLHPGDIEPTPVANGLEYTPQECDIGASLALRVDPFDHCGRPGLAGVTDEHGFFRRSNNGASGGGASGGGETAGMRKGWAESRRTSPPPPPAVEAFPGAWPIFARHAAVRMRHSPALRVCSYNLLCDRFCDTPRGRTELFAAVPPGGLHAHFRAQVRPRPRRRERGGALRRRFDSTGRLSSSLMDACAIPLANAAPPP